MSAFTAKDIVIKPIPAKAARAAVKRLHYSRKVVQNSQLHLGVFLGDLIEGVMQFGPPLDKSKILPLVADTQWSGMLELNRMAFSERLPRAGYSHADDPAALPAYRVDCIICGRYAMWRRHDIPGSWFFVDRDKSQQEPAPQSRDRRGHAGYAGVP